MTITKPSDFDSELGYWDRETQIVSRFLLRYGRVLDSGSFADWPEMFVDAGTYSLITHENLRGEGMSLFVDKGRDALNERAAYVLGYWLTPRRKTLHVITNILVEAVRDSTVSSHACVVLYQVNRRGESILHVTGEYNDEIRLTDDGPRFVSHQIVLDGSTLPADMSAIL
jgi:3-phenylpropionate/cinnamic acid dioxygenase small subunit